jgi:hypothetical protein
MKTIHKNHLQVCTHQILTVREGAIPIHVGLDPKGVPSIYFKVDDTRPHEEIEIYIMGTGHEIPYGAQIHIGSFVQEPYVWHVFTKDRDFPI